MELYVIIRSHGEYEQYEEDIVGVFDNIDTAVNELETVGFIKSPHSNDFSREHDDVPGESVKHTDYAEIRTISLNEIMDEYGTFSTHYKN
jgi:hypothetical protein